MSPVHHLLARTRTGLHALKSLTLAVAALAASGAAWADPPGRVGRLGEMQGTVWLFDDYDGEWIQARRNRPVTEGDRVSSERGARAEIEIGSATLLLDGATDVEFTELNDERVRIRLHGGQRPRQRIGRHRPGQGVVHVQAHQPAVGQQRGDQRGGLGAGPARAQLGQKLQRRPLPCRSER